jgi:hypothetical protein
MRRVAARLYTCVDVDEDVVMAAAMSVAVAVNSVLDSRDKPGYERGRQPGRRYEYDGPRRGSGYVDVDAYKDLSGVYSTI